MLYPNQRNDGCARARTRQGGRACWYAYGRGGYGGTGVYALCVWEGAVRVAASRCALRRRLRPAAHTDAPCRRVPARGSRSVRPCREAGNYVMLCYVMLCFLLGYKLIKVYLETGPAANTNTARLTGAVPPSQHVSATARRRELLRPELSRSRLDFGPRTY